jgi:hypothetical protein
MILLNNPTYITWEKPYKNKTSKWTLYNVVQFFPIPVQYNKVFFLFAYANLPFWSCSNSFNTVLDSFILCVFFAICILVMLLYSTVIIRHNMKGHVYTALFINLTDYLLNIMAAILNFRTMCLCTVKCVSLEPRTALNSYPLCNSFTWFATT